MEGTLEDILRALWAEGRDMIDAPGGSVIDDVAADIIGRHRKARVYWYATPEPLRDANGVLHPAFRGGNANWRVALPGWSEDTAAVLGEVEVDGDDMTYYIVGDPH
ncbi:hypothetical protein Tmar_0060 [Thermaerobacter marianensis DSM 12885]|uniref:Uncharacterized protein n=1 Tax=Thermaerobacter marianensis (strain ATCC 700841 / DSM 12885 / JCM 10246 / 7p75a) TaxID=644966 RepID=E6SKJ8_THEM7|nr:hypothetical protein [Thermaerobacter marianensis]ADU50185.1 hypothetical protein Tmar_0060 [Thermaerobacter marianensis DSM 12885]